MNANELFKAGKLHDALAAQLQAVKAAPKDPNQRLFLFELAAFSGDLDRARKQLDLLTYDTPELQHAVTLYKLALDSEAARRETLRGGKPPAYLADPPAHVAPRLAALQALHAGNPSQASALLDEANAASPSLSGTANGRSFEGIRDADDALGPVLEVFSRGRYFWTPWEQIAQLQISPASTPREVLWLSARLTLRDGVTGDVFLPSIYPFTHEQQDEELQLGRATDWTDAATGPVRGIGGKMFLVGDDGIPLLNLREVAIT